MHIELTLVSILFRGSIFCLFLYTIYHSFIKKSLKQYLENELLAARNEQVEFVEKSTLLLSSRKRIEGQISQQKITFASLEKKYAQFIQAEKQLVEAENQALQKRVENIIEKRVIQKKNLAQFQLLQKAIPQAISRAEEELKTFYNDERCGKLLELYVKKLV